MPTDLWHIHLYRLNEAPCGDNGWGVGLPPESDSTSAWNIDFSTGDVLDSDAIIDSVRDFRQWMKDRDYQEQPLIVSEFGVLPSPSHGFGFSDQTAANFLRDIFNHLLTKVDPKVGYPADDHRLIQAWAWYSLRDGGSDRVDYGGDLFNTNGTLTVIGEAFREMTTAHYTPYVDLQIIPAGEILISTLDGLHLTFYVENRGNTTATNTSAQIHLMKQSQNTVSLGQVLLPDFPPRYKQPPTLISISQTLIIPQADIPTNVVVELASDANDANNRLDIRILKWTAVEVAPAGIFASAAANMGVISVTVTSLGDQLSPQTSLNLSVQRTDQNEGTLLDTLTVPEIQAGMNATVTSPWLIEGIGKYSITATVNDLPVAFEGYSFAKNQAITQVDFRPDLTLT